MQISHPHICLCLNDIVLSCGGLRALNELSLIKGNPSSVLAQALPKLPSDIRSSYSSVIETCNRSFGVLTFTCGLKGSLSNRTSSFMGDWMMCGWFMNHSYNFFLSSGVTFLCPFFFFIVDQLTSLLCLFHSFSFSFLLHSITYNQFFYSNLEL